MVKEAVISMSGGLDSTMLAMELLSQGKTVHAYAFQYGQKHQIELKKLKSNIKFLQSLNLPITLQIIDVRDCFNESVSSLHQGGDDIPHGHYEDDNMKSTVIENRNVIFATIIYGKALSLSKRTGEDVEITLGIHAGDHAVYPDTTKESRDAVAEACRVSNWGSEKVTYVAPFVDIPKDQVLVRGLNAMETLKFKKSQINRVLRNTHSCYDPNEKGESCGKCGTCVERLEAFEKAGIKDPIKYQG